MLCRDFAGSTTDRHCIYASMTVLLLSSFGSLRFIHYLWVVIPYFFGFNLIAFLNLARTFDFVESCVSFLPFSPSVFYKRDE